MESPEEAFEDYREGFLSDEELSSLSDLLGSLKDSGDLIEERGHSVRLYGEPYSYTGSKSTETSEPIPPELKTIIEKINKDLSLEHPLNQVLINHFPASDRLTPSDSFLAMHSDDEDTIVPESRIVTISLGGTRNIRFEPKHNPGKESFDLTLESNSVYVMTQSSQNWFRHGIPPPAPGTDVDERFSITFRSIQKQAKRSILLMGDSNTAQVVFGSGSGKVGKSFPGKRVKATKVENINPQACAGYSNIFLMSGTNNLRTENVKSDSDINRVVDTLKNKLHDIKQLCPDANIFVIPVLPTRIARMNQHVMKYNRLVDSMLYNCFPDVWFKGIYGFLDNRNLLSVRLTREGDQIHLGPRGICKLVTLIKTCVYLREVMNSHSRNLTQESTTLVGPSGPT